MENIEVTVLFILEAKYKKFYKLPENWNKFDTKLKCELLGKALNNEKNIEDLDLYKELVK